MDDYELIAANFQGTIEAVALSADALAGPIERAGRLMTDTLLGDGRIFACGNGADGALAQLFSSNLLGSFGQERPALPVLALGPDSASLTAIAQGCGVEEMYARQLRALAQPGDLLLAICSTNTAQGLARALQTASEGNVRIVLLSNPRAAGLASQLQTGDVDLRVESADHHRTIEIFTMALNSLCTLVDRGLFGAYDQD